MKKSLFIGLLFLCWCAMLYGQGIINKGADIRITQGAEVVIDGNNGNYTNLNGGGKDGKINSDGKITLRGSWYNNSSGTVFTNPDPTGLVYVEHSFRAIHELGGSGVTTFENLTISSGNTAKIPVGTEIRVMYNFLLEGTLEVNGDLFIEGTFIYNGDITGTGTVHYEGTAPQIIAPGHYPKLALNNPGGLTMEDAVNVEIELILDEGMVVLGEHNLVLGPDAVLVENKSSTAWVDATGTGMFIKEFSAPGIFTFPVGNFGTTPVYSPVALELTQATCNNGWVGVRLKPEVHPENNTGPNFPDFLNRYWEVESEGLTDVIYDINFYYAETDVTGIEDEIDGAKYDPAETTNWLHFGSVETADHHFEATEQTEFSIFTGVQSFRAPTIAITDPADKTRVYDYDLTVSGSAADLDGDLEKVFVKLNDGSWELATGSSAWSKSFTLAPGKNIIRAKSKDEQTLESPEDIIAVILSIQEVPIAQGWSIISAFLTPTDPEIEDIMQHVNNPEDLIIMLSEQGIYWPGYNINTIGNWDMTLAYKLKFESTDQLIIRGDNLDENQPIFDPGFYLIPVWTDVASPIAEIFADPLIDVKYIFDLISGQVYWPGGGIMELTELLPGRGYLAFFNSEVTISYPAYEGYVFDATYPVPYDEGPWPCYRNGDVHLISVNMEAAHKLKDAGYIGAFNTVGDCIGYTPIGQKNENYLITIYANDPYTAEKDGADEGEHISFRTYTPITGEETELQAEYSTAFPNHNGLFTLGGLSGIVNFKEASTGMTSEGFAAQVHLFPNPAKEEVNLIIGPGHYLSHCNAEFINIAGSVAKTVPAETAHTKINVADLQPGVYVVKITGLGFTVFKKLVVQ